MYVCMHVSKYVCMNVCMYVHVYGKCLAAACGQGCCDVLKPSLAADMGPNQYQVGREAGCELVHKCVTALRDGILDRLVMSFVCAMLSSASPANRYGME